MHEPADRDFTIETDLSVCMVDLGGTLLSCSAANAVRLGRSIDSLIGCQWRSLMSARDLADVESAVGQAAAGRPSSTILSVLRPDGRIATSRLSVFGTMTKGGRPAVLGVHSTILIPHLGTASPTLAPTAFDVAAYVADLTAELARMAARSHLPHLANCLEAVAGQASEIISLSEHAVSSP